MVPFTWHSAAVEMWHELEHSYNIKVWWDLTASDDVLPVQARAMEMRHLSLLLPFFPILPPPSSLSPL